jgi:hypothetical protein
MSALLWIGLGFLGGLAVMFILAWAWLIKAFKGFM